MRESLVRIVLVLAAVLALATLGQSRNVHRRKRRIDEFGEMIMLSSSRNPLDFNGYGNWCGFGGKGKTVDAIDECCKVHDLCYSHINRDECATMLKYRVYTTEYKWTFRAGEITCQGEDPCERELCSCDKTAALCFGANEDVYNSAHKHSGLMKGFSRLFGMND